MGAELVLFQTPQTTLSLEQRRTSALQTLAQSTSNSTALKAAKQLVELWPHARPANPDTYIAGIGAVLAGYPLAVVQECVDPRRGLALKREFPPTIAAVVEWCDRCKAQYESTGRITDWQIAQLNRPPERPATEEERAIASGLMKQLADYLRTPPEHRGAPPKWPASDSEDGRCKPYNAGAR